MIIWSESSQWKSTSPSPAAVLRSVGCSSLIWDVVVETGLCKDVVETGICEDVVETGICEDVVEAGLCKDIGATVSWVRLRYH